MSKKDVLNDNIIGNDFDTENKYKLYRTVYEIIHPTISKKNISSYKIVLDDNLSPLRVFYPEKVSTISSVIIYIHGNSYVSGSINSYSKICKGIAKKCNKLVIAIDYKSDLGYKFPIGLNECYETIKYLYQELEKVNIDPNKIILMGDSTGGNIVVSITLKAREDKSIKISKEVLIYPVLSGDYNKKSKYQSIIKNSELDLLTVKHLNLFMKNYVNKKSDLKNPLISPLEETNYKDLPPTLIITGDLDPVRDEAIEYFDRLKKENIKTEHLNITFATHGFLNSNDEEIKKEFYTAVNKFME